MSRQSLLQIEREITDQLQRIAVDIAGGQAAGRTLWQAAEWGAPHPLMSAYAPIATPLLMARDALMSEWLARSDDADPAAKPPMLLELTPRP